jgi:hypothetical protein
MRVDPAALALDGIIGQGKYGIVYKAQLADSGSAAPATTVAVKVTVGRIVNFRPKKTSSAFFIRGSWPSKGLFRLRHY